MLVFFLVGFMFFGECFGIFDEVFGCLYDELVWEGYVDGLFEWYVEIVQGSFFCGVN